MVFLEDLSDVLYGGIRSDVPGHGGAECAAYLPKSRVLLETAMSTAMMVGFGAYAVKTYTMPSRFPKMEEPLGKRFLLVLLCLVFGMEVGYKIISKQVLYLLNPCHVMTVVQIYLLAARPNKLSFSVLRMLVHYVYGAVIAMMFPDTMSRFLSGEVVVYWTQHFLIFFVIPPYLIYTWGPSSLEPFREWAWPIFTGIFFGIHNHYILTVAGHLTHVNLNYCLCPATVDPFNGPYYRTWAVFHQAFCLLTLGKLYTLAVKGFLWFLPPNRAAMFKYD